MQSRDIQKIETWRRLHNDAAMVGWDFSRLDGKLTVEKEPWDFEADCLSAMTTSSSIVDIGTGGGGRLMALLDQLGAESAGKRIVATEGWEPNIPIATANLESYGVDVISYDPEKNERLAVGDETFDLVMNRHEDIDASEIARVLGHGGLFITQQVSGFDVPEIHEWFEAPYAYPNVTVQKYSERLAEAGLSIASSEEWEGAMTFADVDSLVIYLGLVPWDVPDFTVDMHADKLLELDNQGPLTLTQRRFRIAATK